MRPSSIVNFERVVLLIVLLSIGAAALEWDRTVAEVARQGVGESTLLAVLTAMLVLTLVLMFLVSRRRSNLARWLYSALAVGMLALSVQSVPRMFEADLPIMLLNVAYLALALVSIWLLFRPDTRTWFARNDSTAA